MTAAPLEPRATHALSTATGVLTFVAIVWGVAGSFIALDMASLWATGLAVRYPSIFGDLSVTRAAQESTVCETAAPVGAAANGAAGLSARDARVAAWFLGLRLGWETQARQSRNVDAGVLDQARAAVQQTAQLLGIPAPDSFTPARAGNSEIEFVAFIEGDGRATARALATAFSPDACRLYKLGAIWGQVEIVRAYVPGDVPTGASDLRYYARQARLPDHLWIRMTQPTDAGASPQTLRAEGQGLTAGVTTYLTNP